MFLAIYYAVWQMSITTMSSLFKDRYGFNETEIVLTFIANGVGSIIGTLVTGKFLDMDYRRVKAYHEARLGHTDVEARSDVSLSAGNPGDELPLEKARLWLVPMFSLT